jgi:hypothetical protein
LVETPNAFTNQTTQAGKKYNLIWVYRYDYFFHFENGWEDYLCQRLDNDGKNVRLIKYTKRTLRVLLKV